jgi:hypothetical protein
MDYRCVFLTSDDRVLDSQHFTAPNDKMACKRGLALSGEAPPHATAIEVWHSTRLVLRHGCHTNATS